jgi:hypothetical protein
MQEYERGNGFRALLCLQQQATRRLTGHRTDLRFAVLTVITDDRIRKKDFVEVDPFGTEKRASRSRSYLKVFDAVRYAYRQLAVVF